MKKSSDQSLSKAEWGFMEQLATIEFMSKFEFTQLLDPKDLYIIIKASCFKTASFIKAIRSYSLKSEILQYPDGESIVPQQLIPFCDSSFLSRVESKLIGKLCELNIKEEEFLLLISVLLCNPAANDLSDNGKEIISIHQKIYSSALFQYCLVTYQQFGPTRFAELLSVCHVINKHVEDIGQLCFLFTFRPPTEKYKRLCAELLSS
uniref:NR LBD domain-containing protein n=1 Tax=Caenorhabditis tropicalis TaxID=1561998 RepID=A0A1I7V3G8_9PELO